MRRSVDGGGETLFAHVGKEVRERALAEVVVVALPLERGVDVFGIVIGPVGQQQCVFAVGAVAFAAAPLDDDGAVQADLLLEPRMRVVPVGAGLVDLEAVGKRGAGRDAVERQPRHAIHVRRQDEAMPVDRRGLAQVVSDADGDHVALAHAQQRRGHLAIHGHGAPRGAGVVHGSSSMVRWKSGPGELRAARCRLPARGRARARAAMRRRPGPARIAAA